MVDDLSYQKTTFISKLNPESPPFQPSSYYQDISQLKSNIENKTNHLHIQPITNNDENHENYYSTTIHSIEPTEHSSSQQQHYIEEITLNNQQSSISSHIESIDQPSLPDVVTETLELNSNKTLSQSEPDDILGNKSILKQTITPGISNTRPTRNALATVSYQLYSIDNLTSETHLIENVTNENFFIGEFDILPAIDLSIQLMDRGEYAIINSDIRHCSGEYNCERMKIDLYFHDWKYAPEIQTLSINERFLWGDKKRERGNFFYRRKEYSSALQSYQNALKFVDINEYPLLKEDEEEENQSSILINRYIQIQNNLAQVYLLNNQYEQCLNSIDNVLKYDMNNIKALFRQAKALIDLGNYDHAKQPLKYLLQNSNQDIDKIKVKEMLDFCEIKLAKYEKNEKEIYKRMFQQSKPTTTTTTTINENSPINNKKKTNNNNNNWWTYVAMGSAVLAAVGLAAFIKYH